VARFRLFGDGFRPILVPRAGHQWSVSRPACVGQAACVIAK
jgi:hypothetical protein